MALRADVDVALLARYWWVFAPRGVLAITFGVLAALMPELTLTALVLLFGSYAIIEGGLNVFAAIRRRRDQPLRWMLLLEGLVSIAVGAITFFLPGLTALVLLYVIAAWAIVTGVLEIAAAIRLRKRIRGEWWLALSGMASVIFGVLVAIFPGAGALALVVWIGAFAMLFGALLIGLAFRLRGAPGRAVGTMAHAA
jgi:uncharacterized membrane protein HdeD (DUF308 family)